MVRPLLLVFILAIIFQTSPVAAQSVGINETGATPNNHAILDVQSATKGVLLPRLSTAKRLALPALKGMLVYDSTLGIYCYGNGIDWKNLDGNPVAGNTWSLTGNAGTDASNFIGTTDTMPLRIRVFDKLSGLIEISNGNTFWGYSAGRSSPTSLRGNTAIGAGVLSINLQGEQNTAIGYSSLCNNFSGSFNTAVGSLTLGNNISGKSNVATGFESLKSNTSGSDNTAVGSFSLQRNTIGNFNTATGSSSLGNNNTGSNNTALGAYCMLDNSSGRYNTAVGSNSLEKNMQGEFNVAIGSLSLGQNISGLNNAALGSYSLARNVDGNNNTAMGYSSMLDLTAGSENVAIGYLAMNGISSRSKNTVIGARAGITAAALENGTALGYLAFANKSNMIRLGSSTVTVIEGAVPFTTPSDGRFKYNVAEDVKGLDFILQLRPVTYQFDGQKFDQLQRTWPADSASQQLQEDMKASYHTAATLRRSGFIAQEVEKAAAAVGYNFSGLNKPVNEQDHYSISYESFVVPIVKAIQDQQKIIDQQNQQLQQQQKEIDKLNLQLQAILRQVNDRKK